MKDYNEEFIFEDDVLQIRLSGTFPKELLRKEENLFQPLIEACSTHQCSKVLVDARKLQVNFNTFNMFAAGEDAASLSRLSLRVALLAREDMIDPFFATVVSNRDGKIGVFTDKQAAFTWLEK